MGHASQEDAGWERDACVRVYGTRARDVPPKNRVNNTEIYLFTGINHQEFYGGVYYANRGVISIDKKVASLFPLSHFSHPVRNLLPQHLLSFFFSSSAVFLQRPHFSMFSFCFFFLQSGCREDLHCIWRKSYDNYFNDKPLFRTFLHRAFV